MEKQFQLPKRLETIIERMPDSGCLADIGCDHAYVAIEAVRRGRAARALACDVRKGPLQQAAEHILCAGLAGKIETRLSDGLEKVAPGEADTVVVAGMGGPLMERILQGRLGDFAHFVLSPQSEIPHFRRFLLAEGMQIDEETMLIDEGKYYVILNVSQRADAASSDSMYVTEEDFLYGGRLLRRLDPVLKNFLEKEKTRYEGILRQTDSREVRTAYQHCMNALEAYR
ncbi:MAG: class I SAM-dependent methyltransferase [Oribacterium sp.]|nr:class I SAM-dependent methyltransferase [Oribacterium sp.]